EDIWVVELARGVISRFTFDSGNDIYPVWSPDGSRLVFGSDREGGVFNLYQKRADGVGSEQQVLKSPSDMVPNSWSPDGRSLVYRAPRVSVSAASTWESFPSSERGNRSCSSRRGLIRQLARCLRMVDG